jgi:hypothetical protein
MTAMSGFRPLRAIVRGAVCQTRNPPMKAKSLLPRRAILGSRLSLRALPPPMTT